MNYTQLRSLQLPDEPGVYSFVSKDRGIIYIGKATSLRDRVRSYFSNDLLHTRGKHIVDMVTLSETVHFEKTASVIEALVLEAALIKKHQPYYNTKEKDNKSWNYVVITNERYPRVLLVRERTMLSGAGDTDGPYKYAFGPYTSGTQLRQALLILRKILPYRDTCIPNSGKPCFNRQIGLCPGICTGEISYRSYQTRISHIRLFFEGKKGKILHALEQSMHRYAQKHEFELANECKKSIFSLKHINDVALLDVGIKERSIKSAVSRIAPLRIEAYDVAHISGKHTVGVMVVLHDGEPVKSEYRKFILKNDGVVNDVLHLQEIIRRRYAHIEWRLPDIIVIDGSVGQKRGAERILNEFGYTGTVLSVVKNEKHRPKAILGNKQVIEQNQKAILLANAESHRFAVAFHRQRREKIS